MLTVRLSSLLARGVPLQVHEAVAIAQVLVRAPGVPTPENVDVSSDGTVTCPLGTPPSPADIAALLLCLLGTESRAPGGVRYAIARACGFVEAPPFASVDDLSVSLARFERGDRADVVRTLLRRIAAESTPFAASTQPAPPTRPARRPGRWIWRSAAVVAAVAGSGLAGFLVASRGRPATPTKVAVVESAAVPATDDRSVGNSERPAPTAGRHEPEDAASVAGSSDPIPALPDENGQGFSPSFSKDGKALFFHTGGPQDATSALVVASHSGPGDLHLTTILDDGARNYHVRPSPDGRLIAFDSDRDGERAVFVANRDGSEISRASGPGYAAVPSWSPDGRSLAYLRAEPGRPHVWNLWVKRGDGAERRLTRFPFGQTWGAAWFPDGRRIAFSHEQDLIVLDLMTGQSRRFASPVQDALVRTPAVSPDASRIVFQVLNHGVWVLNLADGTVQCVLADRTAEEFAWSPDGTRLAFHRRNAGRWQIYELRVGATPSGARAADRSPSRASPAHSTQAE